jgi:hypothetical protein
MTVMDGLGWAYAALCLGTWWLGAVAVARKQRQLFQAINAPYSSPQAWRLNALWACLLLAPLLFVAPLALGAWPREKVIPFFGQGWLAFCRAHVFVVIPAMISAVAGAFWLSSPAVAGADAPSKAHRLQEVANVLIVEAFVGGLASLWLASLTRQSSHGLVWMIAALIIAGFGLHQAAEESPKAIEPAKPREIDEDTPLAAEFRAMGALAGIPVEIVLFQQVRGKENSRAPEPIEVHQRFMIWWQLFNPARPVTPMDLLQKLSAPALTAGVAYLYAARQIQKAKAASIPLWCQLAMLFWLIIILGAIIFLSGHFSTSPNATILRILILILVFTLLAFLIFIINKMGIDSIPWEERTYQQAFSIWRDAAPSEARTELEYFGRVAQFNRIICPHLDKKDLPNILVGSSAGVTQYVERVGREKVLEAMRQALNEME